MSEQNGQPDRPRFFHPDFAPPAAPPAEASDPAAQPPDAPEVPKVFVGGRERTIDEVVAGYTASTAEAQKLAAERDALKREAEAYREMLSRQPAAAPAPEPTPDFEDPASVQAWVNHVAEAKAEQIANAKVKAVQDEMQRYFGTMTALQTAQTAIKARFPNFDSDAVSQYLQSNPDVQQRYGAIFGADSEAALEYAWLKSQQGKGAAPESPRAVQTPSTQKPPAIKADPKAALDEALKEAYATGDWKKYYAIRLHGTTADRSKELQAP